MSISCVGAVPLSPSLSLLSFGRDGSRYLNYPSISFSSSRSVVTCAVRGNRKSKKRASITNKNTHKLKTHQEKEDEIDEDAFEALFSLLEEDLKNDKLLDDEDDEITENDLTMLEKELEEAFAGDDFSDVFNDTPSGSEEFDTDVETYKEEKLLTLENWQLRRLACALKIGRHKNNLKSLSAEIGLDRAFVLDVLRDPPPNLLLLSASLPEEVSKTLQSESQPSEDGDVQTALAETESSEPHLDVFASDANNKSDANIPVHVRRRKGTGRKRFKKAQVETLERVYLQTKRPTNAMISNLVNETNLPWRTVVKWFEDKRKEEGVPQHRVPFTPSVLAD